MPTYSIAILIIGDEILKGEVHEANAYYMARQLHRVGAELGCIMVVRDDVETISRWVRTLSPEYDFLILSGGVGPTHDDVTMEGVARAFQVPLVSNSEIKAMMERWRGQELDEAFLRLTMLPEGTRLIHVDDHFPVAIKENAFILPGVPNLLQKKLTAILPMLASEEPSEMQVNLITDETELAFAEELRGIASRLAPAVTIGSYPQRIGPGRYQVRLILSGRNAEALRNAESVLLDAFPHLRKADEQAASSGDPTKEP